MTDQEINTHPQRLARLAAHPHLEAFEKLLVEHSELEPDDDFENFYSCLVMDLELAWAAAKAIFGDAATPDLAWKIDKTMKKEMRAMWKWKRKKEEEEKQAALDKETKD